LQSHADALNPKWAREVEIVQYRALATDYDGTLAHDGHADAPVRAALERLSNAGCRLILVTGRELEDLLAVFPQIDLFAAAVVENGAMLYHPQTKEVKALCEPPKSEFVEALRARGVSPLSVGHTIVATFRPNESTVLDVIRQLGLELQVVFNKDAVMVLPSGVNKATGLTAALRELQLAATDTVGVGDAENDHAFLAMCGCAVAVNNALPALKERADLVTKAARGSGVVELIERMLKDDLPPPRERRTGTEVADLSLEAGKAD
jgi:HAD superfamily hydrolase (TIGR01484 family)